MKNGNWIPLDKNLSSHLPKNTPFSHIDAMFSLMLDYDSENLVTVSGYAQLWRWSRKKVNKFLSDTGIEIIYPENTRRKPNQKGHIRIHKRDIKGTYKGQIRAIDNKELSEVGDIKGTNEGHKRDIKGSTTKETKDLKTKNLNIKNEQQAKTPDPDADFKNSLVRFGLSKKFVIYLFEKYGLAEIEEAARVFKETKTVDNVEAFFQKAISEKWKSKAKIESEDRKDEYKAGKQRLNDTQAYNNLSKDKVNGKDLKVDSSYKQTDFYCNLSPDEQKEFDLSMRN